MDSKSIIKGLSTQSVVYLVNIREADCWAKRATHLTEVVTSPYSFFSDICRNWMAACCLEHEGWAIGISVTLSMLQLVYECVGD